MITERLLNQIEQGRSGKNHGYTTGSEKLDLYTDGNIKSNFVVCYIQRQRYIFLSSSDEVSNSQK